MLWPFSILLKCFLSRLLHLGILDKDYSPHGGVPECLQPPCCTKSKGFHRLFEGYYSIWNLNPSENEWNHSFIFSRCVLLVRVTAEPIQVTLGVRQENSPPVEREEATEPGGAHVHTWNITQTLTRAQDLTGDSEAVSWQYSKHHHATQTNFTVGILRQVFEKNTENIFTIFLICKTQPSMDPVCYLHIFKDCHICMYSNTQSLVSQGLTICLDGSYKIHPRL